MTVWIAVAIYMFGLALVAIAIGATMKPMEFDKADFALFTFMALVWPVLLTVGIVGILVEWLFFCVIFKPIQFLMYFGQDLGKCFGEMRERRRKRKEREHDKEEK